MNKLYNSILFWLGVIHLIVITALWFTEPHIVTRYIHNVLTQPVLYILVTLWYIGFVVFLSVVVVPVIVDDPNK